MARTSSKRTKRGLNDRHRLFAHLVARPGVSAAAAYREVYPNASASTAETEGPALLRKPQVAELVAKLRDRTLEKVDAKSEEVLAELRHLAFARLSRVLKISKDGDSISVKPLEEWEEHELAALTDVDVEALFEGRGDERTHVGNILKLKMRAKQGALETLAKHHGLLKDVVEHRGTILLWDPYAKPPATGAPAPSGPPRAEGGGGA